jgi:transposase
LAARARETTEEYQTLYPQRAGIEDTLSRGIRAFDPRRSRYVGLVKILLQDLAIAAAINFVRVGQWLNDIPFAKTRQSGFVRLWASPVPSPLG